MKKGKRYKSMRKNYGFANEPIALFRRHMRQKKTRLWMVPYQAELYGWLTQPAILRWWNYPQPKGKYKRR